MIVTMTSGQRSLIDTERGRWERLLLALSFVAATVFVLLEYNVPAADDADEVALSEVVRDLELLPAMEQERLLESVPVPDVPDVAPLIRVVDEPVDDMAILDELIEAEVSGQDTDVDDVPPVEAEMTVTTPDDEPLDMRIVEQLPEFPGGMLYFMKWLTKNVGYPKGARDEKVGGRLVATFIVNTDGTVSDISVLDSFDDRCERAVLDVLRRMPKWTPGIDHGRPCRTMMAVPLVFQP